MYFQKLVVLALVCVITATPTTIYDSTDAPKSMTGTSLTSIINVPDNFLLTDVNVSVDIAAFEASDNAIWLASPTGTTVQLFNGNCGGGFDIIMTFDDEAESGLDACNDLNSNDGSAFQPLSLLAAFDGENVSGIWTLEVVFLGSPDFADDTSLRGWSLIVEGSSNDVEVIPEPATFSAAALGLLGLVAYGYRRRRRRAN